MSLRLTLTGLASQYIHMPLAPYCLKKAVDETLPQVETAICDLNINDTQEELLARLMATEPDVVGVCLLIVEMQVFHVCGVVKRFSAFSPVTERSLGRIVRALGVMAAVLVPLGLPVMEWLTTGLPALFVPLAALLPAFAAVTLMAMVRVVQLLLRRAIELQDEADLTV